MACKRLLSSLIRSRGPMPSDFSLIPNFFSLAEQKTLLTAALMKLDSTGSRRVQRKRKQFQISTDAGSRITTSALDLFLPDEYYEFSEGHYDGVINNYREMHLVSWPTSDVPCLTPVLSRLHSLLPSQNIQTHLLHLASDGQILPHVDNISASGSWILGVSLGASRILRLESCSNPDETLEVLLPSGSVYLQKDSVRFQYKHSVLKDGVIDGVETQGGQRMSIMIRDLISPDP